MYTYIKTFISFAFLASVSTVSANSAFEKGVVEKTYTPAQVIENKNESFPKSYSGSRLEGWALLSYVVAKDGSVNDIEVISHSAVVDTQAEAQRYLNNLVFSPAIKGEQAVESGYLLIKRVNILLVMLMIKRAEALSVAMMTLTL
ncbi:energy transducer TonB [Pseudoalteromonas prydzensis]|jgi:hypothetical protein|uniref:energy transducer TonB n=1 Tax=Pseudoalteromonas prydzensis TaxID=182141 RepID=UPI003704A9A5